MILRKVVILNSLLFASFFCFEPPTAWAAQAAKRIRSNVEDGQTFPLEGAVRPAIALGLARDQGAVSPSQAMPRLSVHFSLTQAQRADLDRLLASQQDRRSPQYRKFLTPEQYADRFGLNTADIEKVTRWLENNGFADVQAARSRTFVSFSGTAAQAQAAFHTSIHKYSLNGLPHIANAANPQLPKALESVVESVRGLDDFRLKPHFTSSSGTTYVTPDDWETIYDVKRLYSAGLDGSPLSGQTYSIAVVGQSTVELSDIDAFRAAAGLAVKDPTVLVPPGDAGPQTGNTTDEAESDLDLEWAGAIAKNAGILFVTASSVENAIAYAIDNDVAPILTTSYGTCEPDLAPADFTTQNTLFAHAAAIGMTIVAASGNSGAADCDSGSIATHGLAVDFPASSQYVTGVGGAEFNASGAGAYFSSSNNSAGGSAQSYIPEIAWNDSNQAASGGGVSTLVPKPTWQTGTGVPNDGFRDVPDIAFTASQKVDGYLYCSAGSCSSGFSSGSSASVSGGTSAASPAFAGVLALLVQSTGTPVGLLNPNLYSLAAISTTVFHDITQGANQVVCQGGSTGCPATASGTTGLLGYSAGIGYDQTTGWGSLDTYNFVEQWSGDIQLASSPSSIGIQPGTTGTAVISVKPLKNFSGTVSFACSVSSSLASIVTCSMPSTTVNTSGTTTLTVTAAKEVRTSPWSRFRQLPPPNPAWFLLAAMLALAIYAVRKGRFISPRVLYVWSAAALLLLTLGAVSCGSGAASGDNVLSLSCSFPQNAQVGVAYIASCTPSGGTSPYTYSVSVGTLPAGLTLNTSSGSVTGTPTVSSGNTFTIQVASGSSLTATALINLDVAPPSPQSGSVTVTATSGAIVNTVVIPVTVQ